MNKDSNPMPETTPRLFASTQAPLTHAEKLVRVQSTINRLAEDGFNQLVTRPYVRYRDIQPLNEYSHWDEVAANDKGSFRLFMKDEKLYYISLRLLLNNPNPTPKLIETLPSSDPSAPKSNIFVIVAKQSTDSTLVYELRVLVGVKSGHPGLVCEKDHQAAVLAGEFYTKDNKLFLASDQSGHFYKQLKDHSSHYVNIFELFFPKTLNYTFTKLESLSAKELEKPEIFITQQLEALGYFSNQVERKSSESSDAMTISSSSLATSGFVSSTSSLSTSPMPLAPAPSSSLSSSPRYASTLPLAEEEKEIKQQRRF